MEKLTVYESLRKVPPEAQKQIQGGRLKGMTDINPMWRIKALTEQFGPCGIGWKYEVVGKQTLPGAKDEIAAFVDINLYINADGKWSDAIPGTGGSMFVSNERNGHYTSDECFKMALTDAISVACKALGVGADVYWEKDRTKYDQKQADTPQAIKCESCGKPIIGVKVGGNAYTADQIANNTKITYGKQMCWDCAKKVKQNEAAN